MLVQIKKLSPDGKIPRGLLISGKPAIKDTYKEFDLSLDLDRDNEKFPHKNSPKRVGDVSPLAAYKRLI
jgi:hypothetical protein